MVVDTGLEDVWEVFRGFRLDSCFFIVCLDLFLYHIVLGEEN